MHLLKKKQINNTNYVKEFTAMTCFNKNFGNTNNNVLQ